MKQEHLQVLAQRLTKRFGEDISQEIILALLEGSLPEHLIEKRAAMMKQRQDRLNKRMVYSGRHPQVHKKFYGEVDEKICVTSVKSN